MVRPGQSDFLPVIESWLQAEAAVESAVLFGSSTRVGVEATIADTWSDVDLHVITPAPKMLERMDWEGAIPSKSFCMQVVRPATGGVRKVTAIFSTGQVDLVIVPAVAMKVARFAVNFGLHRRIGAVRLGLNEMATCLASGYRFLKGEDEWGGFYARVVVEMPGVRLGDGEITALADVFLCELLWVQQKIERGEFAAAQHALHRQLSETNFRLMRELRLRRSHPLPSFGLGRRVESLLPPRELTWVKVEAHPGKEQLKRAARQAFGGLQAMMADLTPGWKVPPKMADLLRRYCD